MRDYLYLWHQPQKKCLIASGIEFRDLLPELSDTAGVVLLRHQFDAYDVDAQSGLEFVPASHLEQLAADDIYGYGDFRFADFGGDVALADLPDASIAALLFFAHAIRPLNDTVQIDGLGNRILYAGHDDGWYARIFYRDWHEVSPLLTRLLLGVLETERVTEILHRIHRGDAAFWCAGGVAMECEQTEDIDALQTKHLIR